MFLRAFQLHACSFEPTPLLHRGWEVMRFFFKRYHRPKSEGADMYLAPEEKLLIGYLSQYCPTPDRDGAISVGKQWAAARDATASHTAGLKMLFGQDWSRFETVAKSLEQKGLAGVHERTSVWDCWITLAGRQNLAHSDPNSPGGLAAPRSSVWERVTAVIAAGVGVGLIAYVIIRNEPFRDLNIVVLFRGLVCMSLAVFAATVPGFLNVSVDTVKGMGIRAGGALAVFVLSLMYTPSVIPVPNGPQPPKPAPAQFLFKTALGFSDRENLPDSLFGDPTKTVERSRQWMANTEAGAKSRLDGDIESFWLLTNEFPDPLVDFDAHVYVATKDIFILGFLVQENGGLRLAPLKRE